MTLTSQTPAFPAKTPDIIKKLLILTCAASIGCGLLNVLLRQLFSWAGLPILFGLSLEGLHDYYLWQIATYIFVLDTGGPGFSSFFFFALIFDMYILWAMGSSIVEKVGEKSFLKFYLATGVFTGIAVLIALNAAQDWRIFSGPTPVVVAILLLWSMLFPELEVLLFFVLPIQAKWLTLIIIGILMLTTLSQLDGTSFIFDLSGAFFAYGYATLAWGLRSPFSVTHGLDQRLNRWGSALINSGTTVLHSTQELGKKTKIFDFKTGEPLLKDEDFVDAMLAKISKYGEKSLTFSEKKRLDEISRNKKKIGR